LVSEVEVSVVAGGRIVETIIRPLRDLNGKPAVTYRKKLWPLNGGQITIDGTAPRDLFANGSSIPVPAAAALPNTACQPIAPPQPSLANSREQGSRVTVAISVPDDWDISQQSVIDAAASSRMFVSAGPGTGKTAVACARVAALVERGEIDAVNVWIVSFTRTAVQEIRQRIASYLGDEAAAAAIRIATLDSHAWAIHSGFDRTAQIKGLYEENIEKVIEAISGNADVEDYLQSVQLLVVDEAQDVIGIRADLVSSLIDKISPGCGVSIFADEAQAIYGFSEDETDGAEAGTVPLVQRIKQRGDFDLLDLDTVHRTESENLHKIFTEVRASVLRPDLDGAAKKSSIKQQIVSLSDQSGLHANGFDFSKLDSKCLVLFRRRAEALLTSQYLNTPHRLRLSGLPNCLYNWLAICFWDYTEPRLGRSDFERLYHDRVPEPHGTIDRPAANSAWNSLVELAGQSATSVDIARLRRVLGRRQPPNQFCSPELGSSGPILGTIHASKGREAEHVILFMPVESSKPRETENHEEEARVVFVGATRARKQLHVGQGYRHPATSLKSGRAYCFTTAKGAAAMVEFGREGDIQPSGVAGRQAFASASDAYWAQRRYLDFDKQTLHVTARADRSADFTYKYYDPLAGRCLGALSTRVKSDLWNVAEVLAENKKWKRLLPPAELRHLRLVNSRSLVVPPDDPELENLHEPFATSGFMLAPVLLGYSKVYFQW
jgi:hypothetical protein